MLTIIDTIRDPKLFGPWFRPRESWTAWLAFLAALFGLEMSPGERQLFRRHTGRQDLPAVPACEGWVIVGRRGGKSFIAALVAVFLACFRDYSDVLAPETGATQASACRRRTESVNAQPCARRE